MKKNGSAFTIAENGVWEDMPSVETTKFQRNRRNADNYSGVDLKQNFWWITTRA